MKVMCIFDQWWWEIIRVSGPAYGEICTVLEDTEKGYLIAGYQKNPIVPDQECYYDQNGFVPLSDIDETEMVKEREVVYELARS